jgi:hypothetical protein
MQVYTKQGCEQWLAGCELSKPDATPGLARFHYLYPIRPYQVFFVTHWIASTFPRRMPVLLWITEWGIWPSSENWHLYYRLRESYGDRRLLHDAPGHLFLEHEAEDIASFLQLAMLNGWGGYLIPQINDVRMFFSHDEYIDFYAKDQTALDNVREALPNREETEKTW